MLVSCNSSHNVRLGCWPDMIVKMTLQQSAVRKWGFHKSQSLPTIGRTNGYFVRGC